MTNWKYFKDAEFIYNGTYNDATLLYKGIEFNSNIVLDTIWERFNDEYVELGLDVTSEVDFTKYCNDNYFEIQELMELAIGNNI